MRRWLKWENHNILAAAVNSLPTSMLLYSSARQLLKTHGLKELNVEPCWCHHSCRANLLDLKIEKAPHSKSWHGLAKRFHAVPIGCEILQKLDCTRSSAGFQHYSERGWGHVLEVPQKLTATAHGCFRSTATGQKCSIDNKVFFSCCVLIFDKGRYWSSR